MTKVNQPSVPLDGRGSTESPQWRQESKGVAEGSSDQQHPDSKDPPPKSSSKTLRGPSEGPQPGKRGCPKSPAQQEPPPRQTVGSKQPRKPAKGSGQAEPQASSQAESEVGPLPYGSKEQTSKDRPKVKTKGRPRAVGSREPKPEVPAPTPQAAVPRPKPPVPTPSEKRKHKSSTAPSKAPSAPQPPKDSAGDRNPEHSALVSLTQSQGPSHSSRGSSGSVRTSGCRQAVIAQGDGCKDKLLLPLRDTKLLSPLRDSPPPTSLVVKITLDLLTRIPQPLGKGSRPRKAEDKQLSAGKKQDSETKSCDSSSRVTKKRKVGAETGGGMVFELWKLARLSCLSRAPLGLHPLPVLRAVTRSGYLESLKASSFCTPHSAVQHFYVLCRYGLLPGCCILSWRFHKAAR